jgi:Raf kinase inhibitor-like YbhB/YbcL family protein
MSISHEIGHAFGNALRDVHAGTDRVVSRRLVGAMPPRIEVTSPDFAHGERLPVASTVDGAGLAPTIEWTGLPPGTKSVAFVCEDPDAPLPEPYVHWIAYGIPATTTSIAEGSATEEMNLGKNSKRKIGFTPSAPPPGHGLHHYHFQVFALDTAVDLEAGADRPALVERMKGHILGWGEIVGTNERE